MTATSRFLGRPRSYRLWQAPFAEAKLAPALRHNDLNGVRRVLDVGCGPGTNAGQFRTGVDYLGVDINPRYIEYARRRFDLDFMVADATRLEVEEGERFDFVLVNSFLHHIPDDEVDQLLAHLSTVVSDDGHIHVLELERPKTRSIARLLADLDRGDYPRPLGRWRELLTRHFAPVVCEPYPLGGPRGVPVLWNMIYFKGRPRARSDNSPVTAVPG